MKLGDRGLPPHVLLHFFTMWQERFQTAKELAEFHLPLLVPMSFYDKRTLLAGISVSLTDGGSDSRRYYRVRQRFSLAISSQFQMLLDIFENFFSHLGNLCRLGILIRCLRLVAAFSLFRGSSFVLCWLEEYLCIQVQSVGKTLLILHQALSKCSNIAAILTDHTNATSVFLGDRCVIQSWNPSRFGDFGKHNASRFLDALLRIPFHLCEQTLQDRFRGVHPLRSGLKQLTVGLPCWPDCMAPRQLPALTPVKIPKEPCYVFNNPRVSRVHGRAQRGVELCQRPSENVGVILIEPWAGFLSICECQRTKTATVIADIKILCLLSHFIWARRLLECHPRKSRAEMSHKKVGCRVYWR